MIDVKIKKLYPNAILPTKAHPTDACFDIYAYIENVDGEIFVPAHTTVKVNSGFATAIPVDYWGAGFARSGMATKQSLRPANCTMVIDADYRGEWIVPIHNDSNDIQVIHNGDRIAQFMILPVLETELEVVDDLDSTERGAGGFGSSGK